MTLIPPKPPKVNAALGIAMPKLWQYEVTGIFNTGMFQYDNQFVVMSLPAAQQFTGMGSAVSGIEIRLRNPDTAPAVGVRLVEKLGYPFRYLDWQSQNAGLFSALQLEKIAMGLVIFFIMIVAAFNIVGTLTMVVTDKTREIGILQAMGVTGRSIGKIFLLQGALIGAVGTFTGLAIGLLIAYIVDRSGWVRIDPSVYFIDRLPVHVQLLDVLVVIAASFLLAARGHLVPGARRGAADAGRSDPARVMALLEARGIRKVYEGGDGQPIDVLTSADLSVTRGEFVAIMGASGAGKSTLLHLLGALDRPTGGTVSLDGSEYHDAVARRARRAAEPEDRVRVPVPSPAAGVHGAGERDASRSSSRGAQRRQPGPGPRNCSRRSVSRAG